MMMMKNMKETSIEARKQRAKPLKKDIYLSKEGSLYE